MTLGTSGVATEKGQFGFVVLWVTCETLGTGDWLLVTVLRASMGLMVHWSRCQSFGAGGVTILKANIS